jgi:hypothetical protein
MNFFIVARTLDALADGSAWHDGYVKFGQLTSARRRWSDGSPVAGQSIRCKSGRASTNFEIRACPHWRRRLQPDPRRALEVL